MTARGPAFAGGRATKTRAMPIKLKSTRDLVILSLRDARCGGLRYVGARLCATHFKVRSRVRHDEKAVRRTDCRAQSWRVLRSEVPQDVLQDSAILEIFELVEGIYSAD